MTNKNCYYKNCSICSQNIGHYCDECEMKLGIVIYEIEKIRIDYLHLKQNNEEIRKLVRIKDLINPENDEINMLKIKVDILRNKILESKRALEKEEEYLKEEKKLDYHLQCIDEKTSLLKSINNSIASCVSTQLAHEHIEY